MQCYKSVMEDKYSYIPKHKKVFRETLKDIGLNIRALRIAQGMSQQELATRAELSCGTLSELERGVKENVTLCVISKLGAALSCSTQVFLKKYENNR